VWEGYALAQGDGETWFPHAPARERVWEGYALAQGDGETRFPHAPARERVWEGYALAQGDGETRFPHAPARERVWEAQPSQKHPGGKAPAPWYNSRCGTGICSPGTYTRPFGGRSVNYAFLQAT